MQLRQAFSSPYTATTNFQLGVSSQLHCTLCISTCSLNDPQRHLLRLCCYHCQPHFPTLVNHIIYHHEHRHSSSSRIGTRHAAHLCHYASSAARAATLATAGFWPNSGIRGVRRGRMCGVARGCICVLLPPLEGSPQHGPSRGGGLPPHGFLLAHLNSEGMDSFQSLEHF